MRSVNFGTIATKKVLTVIKGVIFDLDGTLIDSLVDVAEYANTVLEKYGFDKRKIEDYRYLAGQGAYNLMSASSGSGDKTMTDKMAEEFKVVYEKSDKTPVVYSGIADLLAVLEEKGIKSAVLSNKPDHLTKLCVKRAFGDFCFSAVVGHKEGYEVKPNPKAALEIAGVFGLRPDEIAIVGDTKNDILTAKNGGFYAVGVTWGFRDRDELLENGADLIIDTPLQILNII